MIAVDGLTKRYGSDTYLASLRARRTDFGAMTKPSRIAGSMVLENVPTYRTRPCVSSADSVSTGRPPKRNSLS
jgi:hypothetical protein